jgi:hypothetical protein
LTVPWTLSIVLYSTNRPLRFGSWMCSCLQLRGTYLVGSTTEG